MPMYASMSDLDHGIDDGPQQQVLVLHSVSINKIMPCIVDIDVINGYHHLTGGGEGQSPSSENSTMVM